MHDKLSISDTEQLQAALDANDTAAISAYLSKTETRDLLHAITSLSDADQSRLLLSLSDEAGAKLVDRMHDIQAAQMLERLSTDKAAAIVSGLPSDERADVIARLSIEDASKILAAMPAEEARGARRLMSYPPDSAGGLMVTEYLAYDQSLTVADVLDDLRTHSHRYRSFDVQYAYVVADGGKLVGVLRLRDLLLSAATEVLADVMIREPHKVRDTAGLEILERFFDRRPLFGVPAVDADGVLMGVVRSADVEKAAGRTVYPQLPQIHGHRRRRRVAIDAAQSTQRPSPELADGEHRAQYLSRQRHRVSSRHAHSCHRIGRIPAHHFRYERLLR